MVVLNKIYTRTGDDGTTALGTGERLPKHALRVSAYGTVDETNAAIGVARTNLSSSSHERLSEQLERIQNDLFDLGADLCVPDRGQDAQPLRVTAAQVQRLEREIDEMTSRLKPLRSFVLPGGSPVAAHLHMARTVCRRAERLIVELARSEPVGQPALEYINRLSDYLFVAARHANDDGARDVLWVPGQNR
jgi:cob(I)alamin adenosyltransferase